MANEQWHEWIGILVQVPLLGVFVWFVLQIRKDEREAFQSYLENSQIAADKFQRLAADRDIGWRDFLREEREQRRLAMQHGIDALAEMNKSHEKNMTHLSAGIEHLALAVKEHDQEAMKRLDSITAHMRKLRGSPE